MVTCEKLSKEYRTGSEVVQALKEASICVPEGSMSFFMGPSGSGKSTALKIIGGQLCPSSGRVEINGCVLNSMSEKELCSFRYKEVGIVPQDYMVLDYLTVWDNILLGIRVGELAKKEKDYYERARSLLSDSGLEKEMNRKAGSLSGGQRQRVAIVRALLKSPHVLLLDEPTANLDSERTLLIMEKIRKLTIDNNNVTIISTHDNRLTPFADSIYNFYDGLVTKA